MKKWVENMFWTILVIVCLIGVATYEKKPIPGPVPETPVSVVGEEIPLAGQ